MNIYDALKQFDGTPYYESLVDQIRGLLGEMANNEPEEFAKLIDRMEMFEMFPINEEEMNYRFANFKPWEIASLLPGCVLDYDWYYSDETNVELLEHANEVLEFRDIASDLIECNLLDWVDTNKLEFPYSGYEVLADSRVIATFTSKADAELFVKAKGSEYTIKGVR